MQVRRRGLAQQRKSRAHGAAALDALDGLDAVADGVAEVEGLAHALLSLVLLP